ncbi:hypothetical protein KUTeg_006589 [Tegillarca granosa]|uniref:THAP-type domain-containing protein n=1 Tax=Tegillarca granosa TaxID=220873 RepID=A0ABQ9FAP5_TEGGR|nr:hypothetical protein KUTeg_006589 [Tegillarca granosa]
MASNMIDTESVIQQNKTANKSKYHCCVPFCTSDSRYNKELHFHHIPKNPTLKKDWIIKIRGDEGPLFKITQATVVCSKHFKKEDYRSWTPVRKSRMQFHPFLIGQRSVFLEGKL